mgnify:FL=1|tara:strand:- start:299 stop:955 length:657 start_codon:yes stop_codon:yes gene_type:complete
MTKQTNVELKQADNIENIRSVQSAKYENVLESLEMRFGDQLVEPVRAVNYSDGTAYNMGEMDFTIQMNQEIPALQKRLEKVLKFIQITEDQIKRLDAQIGGSKTYSSQDLFQQNMEIAAKQREALEQRLETQHFGRNLILADIKARVDFYKKWIGEDWKPYNSNVRKSNVSPERKKFLWTKQGQKARAFYNANAGKIDSAIDNKDGTVQSEIIPAIAY